MEELAKRVLNLKKFSQSNRQITPKLQFYIDEECFLMKSIEDSYFHFSMNDIELTHYQFGGGKIESHEDIEYLERFDYVFFLDDVEEEIKSVEEKDSVPQEIVIDGVKFVRA